MLRLLRITYIGELLTELLLIAIFQFVPTLHANAHLTDTPADVYVLQVIGIAFILVCIPLAFRLMSIGYVRRQLAARPATYTTWYIVRIMLLAVPMLVNTVYYYLLGNDATYAYLAIIACIALLYFWPTQTRLEHELRGDAQ